MLRSANTNLDKKVKRVLNNSFVEHILIVPQQRQTKQQRQPKLPNGQNK